MWDHPDRRQSDDPAAASVEVFSYETQSNGSSVDLNVIASSINPQS
jgi:hypothetical protein